MGRSVAGIEGLALRGSGTVGPVSFPLPGLLWSAGARSASLGANAGAALLDGTAPGGGRRRLRIQDATGEIALEFPILGPESSGHGGGFAEAAPGVQYLHWPLEPADWEALRAARADLVILGNARVLFAEGEPFVRALADIRNQLGAAPLLWLPRVALPNRLAYLVYVGADLLDTTAGLWAAAEGNFLDPLSGTADRGDSRAEAACGCPGCATGDAAGRAQHALAKFAEEFARVRTSLRGGWLRPHVEARLASEPLLAELLRYTDIHLAERLEERTPVTSDRRSTYVLRESFRRPEAVRFRQRFLARYRPPPSKRVLLVVPCSKTKPYRNSRSHRRFANALRELPHLEQLHVVSVTSPIGLVPRELEDFPPARHYDIPVTGSWDETERDAVRRALAHLLATGPYRAALVHLDPEEYSFTKDLFPPTLPLRWTQVGGEVTSRASLGVLRRQADEFLSPLPSLSGGPLRVVSEELAALAAFQFGSDAARRLFEPPVRLQGRPWFQRVTDGGRTDLATWREERGLFQLTVAGGERMLGAGALTVEVDPGVTLSGDLFTPGVRSAYPAIRAGDAVLLVRDAKLLGVGEAELPGPLMTQLPRGRAVRVRHRVHPVPPAAPTVT